MSDLQTNAGTQFVSRCDGVKGTIWSLTADKNFKNERVLLPIDNIVADSTREEIGNDNIPHWEKYLGEINILVSGITYFFSLISIIIGIRKSFTWKF